jgi:hypothetical protein
MRTIRIISPRRKFMAHANTVKLPDAAGRPHITSYDTGFEHSLEHWTEVRHLVEEAEEETTGGSKTTHTHGILAIA